MKISRVLACPVSMLRIGITGACKSVGITRFNCGNWPLKRWVYAFFLGITKYCKSVGITRFNCGNWPLKRWVYAFFGLLPNGKFFWLLSLHLSSKLRYALAAVNK